MGPNTSSTELNTKGLYRVKIIRKWLKWRHLASCGCMKLRTVTPHSRSFLPWEELYCSKITLAVQMAEVSAVNTDLYKLDSTLKTSDHMQNLLKSTWKCWLRIINSEKNLDSWKILEMMSWYEDPCGSLSSFHNPCISGQLFSTTHRHEEL